MSPVVDGVAVTDGVFSVGDGGVRLLGQRSRRAAPGFPRTPVCGTCAAPDPEPVQLGATGGTLFGWTTVQVAPPGYEGPVPYGFGIVELDEGIRILGRLTEPDPARLGHGQRMVCTTDVVGTDDEGRDLLVWAFAPAEPVGDGDGA